MGFNVGETAGDYQIIGILGAGGMGKVYKARNIISDRVEALKVLLPNLASEPELADRFMREIKLLASLDHPNIAGLHTALRLENQLLMVMEFVEGRTLEDRLKDGPVPVREAVNYVIQALSALGYAHERGVVHRDIKPANMMVTPSGQIKLMDFGIAKAVADRRLTMTGTTLGSLFYMSPEQVKGASDIDGRSDLYSMGVSLYEIVTGTRPFKGDSDYSIMVAHLEQQPIAPIQIEPSLPAALNEIILTSIQKDVTARFQTAQAFRAALESVAQTLGEAPYEFARPVARATPVPAPPTMTPTVAAVPAPQTPLPPPVNVAPPPPPPPAWAQAAPPPPPPNMAMGAPPPGPAPWAQGGPPPMQMPPPGPPKSSGHRGVWMALGAVVAIAVIALAIIQVPKWMKTRAQGGSTPPATEQSSQSASQSQESATPPATQSSTESTGQAQADAASQSTAPASATSPTTPSGSSASTTPAAVTPPPRVATIKSLVEKPPKARSASAAPSYSAGQTATTEAAPPPPPPPPAQLPPKVDPAALEKARDKLANIGIRANALRSTLQTLEQQQKAMGVGLRTDIVQSWKRMEFLLDDAEAALKSENLDRARKQLNAAEKEADRLDKFLGH